MESLPPDILYNVNLAVKKKVCSLRKNKSQKKRKTIRLKRNIIQRTKQVKKSNKGRSTQQICKQVNQPTITVTYPLTMNLVLPQADSLTTVHAPPILLDKSTVPRGQMLPVCQDQFLSASFKFVENNWINQASAFTNAASCAFTSSAISHTSLPQMGQDPSSSHILWDVTSSQVDPVAYPSINSGPTYSPPEQSVATNFIIPSVVDSPTDSPLLGPTDSVSVEDFINELFTPPSVFQSATSDDLTPENGSHPALEALCDPTLVQQSDLCSSSSLADGQCDLVSPFWMDLLLDSSDNFFFPDANLVDLVLSGST
ncbi:uncharacterized protein LOC111563686 [Amphiprion ocellaris]|uniref:uncharacterized protein LOC111563686 n=1 Tax=Amphiprion ocellaris TaxID=80972 RepID=UPI0024118708|nr:uncharacterized protein LOC111563686 [Amphiprion ocellaris]